MATKRFIFVLFDLSADFDTVDYNILIERLEKWVAYLGQYWTGFYHTLKAVTLVFLLGILAPKFFI